MPYRLRVVIPQASPRVFRDANWGALAATPAWRVSQRFLGLVLCAIAFSWLFCWPLAVLNARILFFVRGTQWSWWNGRRWRSFEEFADSLPVRL